MLKGRFFLVILSALVCCTSNVSLCRSKVPLTSTRIGEIITQGSVSPIRPDRLTKAERIEPLLSQSVADRFYEIASALIGSDNVTTPQAEQAIVFLTAARELAGTSSRLNPPAGSLGSSLNSERILSLLIRLACENSNRDNSQQVYSWLAEYVSKSARLPKVSGGFDRENAGWYGGQADLDVARSAITYLLDRCDTREQREKILEQIMAELEGKNAALDSEAATLLGLLMVEKADFIAAQSLFVRAYLNNKYNKQAFTKLVELAPEKVSPAIYFEHLRLMLRENPMDIDAALAFAQYAESAHGGHLYDIAAAAYKYCADLFSFLNPDESLPPSIYLPWIISSYNSEQNRGNCVQIAEYVRRNGRFDILVEALAGRAAAKIGDKDEAERIFQAAELKAQQLLKQGPEPNESAAEIQTDIYPQQLNAKQFAWFYCFAKEDASKALNWANKAYSTDSGSAFASALLAYALMMNQQMEWAKPLVENYERNQISDLVQAQVQLAEGQKDAAIETLKSAISRDPASLAAERAKELLAQQGQRYSPPVDPNYVLSVLRNSFGQAIVPEFMSPDKIISVQFSAGSNEFSYGSELSPMGQITIMNNSPEPIVISNDGLFNGNIRIDVTISGDLNRNMPSLVSLKIGSAPVIEPGKSLLAPVRLVTGELRQLLLGFPQASLNLEFTLYLDPIPGGLLCIKPVKIMVRRPGVELSSSYLQNLFSSIRTSRTSRKISIAELFVGLLKEQHTMTGQGTLYRYKYAEWMPSFLKSALLQDSGLLLNTVKDNWEVNVHTMAEMLSLPLDAELMNVVAKNLKHPRWPVRMIAVYLLAKSSENEFDGVLNWAAENDSCVLIRDMASACTACPAPLSDKPM